MLYSIYPCKNRICYQTNTYIFLLSPLPTFYFAICQCITYICIFWSNFNLKKITKMAKISDYIKGCVM